MKIPTAREWMLFAAVLDAKLTRDEFAAEFGYDHGPGFNDANDRLAELHDSMRSHAKTVRDECRRRKVVAS